MSAVLADARTRFVLMIPVGLVLLLTLSRTWRLPNSFANAHWLLDYRFGFVKRGLAGSVLSATLRPFGVPPSAAIISGIAIALLAILALVLLWTAWQVVRTSASHEAAALMALAFVSSPFIVISAHLTGYLDGILLVLAVTSVSLAMNRQLLAAAVLTSLAILVHESAIFIGFPVLVLAWWVSRPNSGWALALPIATFVLLGVSVRWLPPTFQDLYSRHLQHFPFVTGDMHIFVPEWLTPGFTQHLAEQQHHFAERLTSAPMLGLVLPTVLALFAWTIDACRIRARSITMALLVGVIVAPQLMHLVAWDTMRIWTYSIAMAWLAAWTLTRASGAQGHVSVGVSSLAIATILMNVMDTTFLLDNQTDHYSLTTRLLLFSPVIAGALLLFLKPKPATA